MASKHKVKDMTQAIESNKAFNVGDKIVSLRFLHLWDSDFYHVRFLSDAVHVVTSANDKFFTFTPNLELPDQFDRESYAAHNAYSQVTGVCYTDIDKVVFSLERDFVTIRALLDGAFAAVIQKTNDDFKNIVIEPSKNFSDVGRFIQEQHTNTSQFFAKKTFLFTRFQEVVDHLFAK